VVEDVEGEVASVEVGWLEPGEPLHVQPGPRRRCPIDAVLVLNADLGPLHRVSLRHAVRMLCRQVAEVHEAEPDRLIGVWPVPRVVRLVRYVVTRWRYTGGPAWSRSGVMARDGH